jgi:hypothetical protein
MTETKNTTTSAPTTSAPLTKDTETLPLTAAERRPKEEQTQEQEIQDHREKMQERHDAVIQSARDGEQASFEGARPEFEPLPGEAKGSIPDGLTIGGPVLSLEEQDRIARSRGKEGSPVPHGKAKNQQTSNT